MTRRSAAGAVVFLSAFLLFSVQPHWGRRLAPTFGGGPAVWNACLLLFQAALLVGYGYARRLTHRRPRSALPLHAGLLSVGCLWTFVVSARTPPVAVGSPTLEALALLAVVMGLPAALLSATTPLLHRWFVDWESEGRTGYGLYAFSNAGSLAALLLYPTLIEPWLGLDAQWLAWRVLLGFFAAAMIVLSWRAGGVHPPMRILDEEHTLNVHTGGSTSPDRLDWFFWSAIASALLVSTTQRITEDVAGGPLLWLPPLALFLLASILAFARWTISIAYFAWLLPMLLLLRSAVQFSVGLTPILWLQLAVELGVLFFGAWVAFSRLYALRPADADSGRFYEALAFGGAVGGCLASLLPPQLFHSTAEHPLLLFLLAVFLPSGSSKQVGLRAALLLAVGVLLVIHRPSGGESAALEILLLAGAMGMLFTVAMGRAPSFGIAMGVPVAFLVHADQTNVVHARRSEFGVHRVVKFRDEWSGEYHALRHGGVVHGWQCLEPARRHEPLGYYHPESAVGEALAWRTQMNAGRAAVVGLGAGAALVHRRVDQAFDFFEIDPAVARLAGDVKWFSYLSDAGPHATVHVGDGRLLLAAADQAYSTIFLDAFSGDAVPTHLLTREAFRTYRRTLKSEGVVVANITNWYVNLEATIVRVAESEGMIAVGKRQPRSQVGVHPGPASTHALVMAVDESELQSLLRRPGWRRLSASPQTPLWTDDYSNLWSVLRWTGAED